MIHYNPNELAEICRTCFGIHTIHIYTHNSVNRQQHGTRLRQLGPLHPWQRQSEQPSSCVWQSEQHNSRNRSALHLYVR